MKALGLLLLICVLCLPPPGPAAAQEEVTSDIARYGEREFSGLGYETYEASPMRLPAAKQPVQRIGPIGFPPGAPPGVGHPARLVDSHSGIGFYGNRTCLECHSNSAMDIHSARLGITCRQCHGGEPIASADHYYSPMNPIRRHAYVCAKCHEGAGASFAAYVVHEPDPSSPETARTFPALFWAFWIMVGITFLTFALFLPHTLLWVVRDLFARRRRDAP